MDEERLVKVEGDDKELDEGDMEEKPLYEED
jgi:hypothetical protein